MPSELSLRRANVDDLPAIAELYQRVREAAVPAMPPLVHTPGDVVAWTRGWDLSVREVWVAETDHLVGFLAMTGSWLDDLYVDPAGQRDGVGSALLEVAMATHPQGFALWVFETNHPALAFYRRHGLVELERTDGSGNEERSPDIRMVWPGEDAVGFLRGQIDEVDRELGQLLARRAALTAVVQDHKPVPGQAGRDPLREREIAEGMAVHAPALGADRLARIVHTIISESLDAVDSDR